MFKVLLIFSFLSSLSISQNELCGIWVTENSYSNEYENVLILNEVCKGSVIGYSYDQDEKGGYCSYQFVGKLKGKKRKTILKGKCTYSFEKSGGHVATSLKLKVEKGVNIMEGSKWITRLGVLSTRNVVYKKINVNNFKKNKSYSHVRVFLDKLEQCECVSKKDSVDDRLATRKNKLLNTFKIQSAEVILKLKDSNEEDGDKISIYLNGKLIRSGVEVKKRKQKMSIILPPHQKIHTLTFVADNLGRVPPNTANIEISNGKDKYKVTLNCDMKTNNEIIIEKP